MLKLNKEKEIITKIHTSKLVRVLTILSKAYARIALKKKIDVKDVQKIIKIYKKSLVNLNLI